MFSKQLLEKRMQRAYGAMEELDVDLWLSIGRETHFTVDPVMMFLLPAAVLPVCALAIGRSRSVCIVAPLDAEEVQTYGPTTETIVYTSDFDEELIACLRSFGKLSRIALNFSLDDPSADGLSFTQHQRIMHCLDAIGFDGEIVSSTMLMKRTRAQKSPEEVEGIANTVQTAMHIYEEARSFIRSGISGKDIQSFFWEQVRLLDGDYSWPKLGNPFVSVGTKSSYLCKRPPSDIFTAPGDLINVDFGLRINGFASDNQRSFYVLDQGETAVPGEVQKAFEAVQAAIRAAVSVAAPGVMTTVPRDAANEVFQQLGYPPVRSLGHELGTFAHEGGMRCGMVSPSGEMDYHLEAGMTFTMEPAIITSHGRLCQEEVIAITADGCRMLSTPQKEVWKVR